MSYKTIHNKIKDISNKPDKIKAILYGKAGTGKTTLAGTFPKPLLVDIKEEGQKVLKGIKGIKTMSPENWEELNDLYWYLKKEKHNFETVILDTVGNAQLFAVEAVVEKKGSKTKGKKAGDWGTMTQQMWGEVSSMCKELFINFRDLPMNVVFIAHDRIFKANEEEDSDGDIIRIAPHVGPALSPSIASTLNASANLIGETFIGETIKIKKDEKTKKKTEIRKVKYYLRIGPNSSYITKVRKPKHIDLPEMIANPEYKDLLALFG